MFSYDTFCWKVIFIACIACAAFLTCVCASFELNSTSRLLLVGDGIAHFGYVMPNGFMSFLSNQDPNIQVYSKAKIGGTISEGFRDIEVDLDHYMPTHVIVMYGVSDALLSDELFYGESFQYYLEAIVATLLDKNMKIMIISPTVIDENVFEENQLHYNLEIITSICKRVAADFKVSFLDVFTQMHKHLEHVNTGGFREQVLTRDSVHLNERGNRFVAYHLLLACSYPAVRADWIDDSIMIGSLYEKFREEAGKEHTAHLTIFSIVRTCPLLSNILLSYRRILE